MKGKRISRKEENILRALSRSKAAKAQHNAVQAREIMVQSEALEDSEQAAQAAAQTSEVQAAESHGESLPPGRVPWGTVALLAVLCVASLTTGFYYWYNNYFVPSQYDSHILVEEPQELLPVIGELHIAHGLADDELTEDYYVYEAPEIPLMDPLPEFVELWEEYGNDNIVGILYLADHEELVFQTSDNSFYLTHDIYHEYSEVGRAFLDYSVDLIMGSDNNMVIYIPYGVAIRNILIEYINYDFFLAHPTILFSTLYGDFDWEIFSFYIAPASLSFKTVNHADEYSWGEAVLHYTLASLYNTRLDVTEFDQIVTIISPTEPESDMYYVLQARMLRQITS